MEMYARQHFDALLRDAAANYAERCVYRAGGPAEALVHVQSQSPDEFVAAVFTENLLDDTAGAVFVLEALNRRTVPADPGGPVAEVLARLARAAFAEVLVVQTCQILQQQQIYS